MIFKKTEETKKEIRGKNKETEKHQTEVVGGKQQHRGTNTTANTETAKSWKQQQTQKQQKKEPKTNQKLQKREPTTNPETAKSGSQQTHMTETTPGTAKYRDHHERAKQGPAANVAHGKIRAVETNPKRNFQANGNRQQNQSKYVQVDSARHRDIEPEDATRGTTEKYSFLKPGETKPCPGDCFEVMSGDSFQKPQTCSFCAAKCAAIQFAFVGWGSELEAAPKHLCQKSKNISHGKYVGKPENRVQHIQESTLKKQNPTHIGNCWETRNPEEESRHALSPTA